MIMQLSDKALGAVTAVSVGIAALVASLPAAADQSPLQGRPGLEMLAQAGQAAPAPVPDSATERRVQARIKSLHDQLHITAGQKPQWDAVAAVMQSNADAISDLVQKRAQEANMMSAVDDLRSYQQIAEAHVEGLNKLVPPFEALYDTMTDDQKKNADAVFGHLHRHAAVPHQATK
jgi:LTXXQ motif family protein